MPYIPWHSSLLLTTTSISTCVTLSALYCPISCTPSDQSALCCSQRSVPVTLGDS